MQSRKRTYIGWYLVANAGVVAIAGFWLALGAVGAVDQALAVGVPVAALALTWSPRQCVSWLNVAAHTFVAGSCLVSTTVVWSYELPWIWPWLMATLLSVAATLVLLGARLFGLPAVFGPGSGEM